MPRKAYYSKSQIVESAIRVIRKKGFEALSARELSKEMGCSTSPIFTVYDSFDQVKEDAMVEVFAIFNRYVADALNYQPAFKEYGRRLVYFSKDEPMLFRAMQMRDHRANSYLNDVERICKDAIMKDYGFNLDQASMLIDQMYIFGTGLATEMAFGSRPITDEEINMRLGFAFMGTIMLLKQGKQVPVISPHLRDGDDLKITLEVDFDHLPKEK